SVLQSSADGLKVRSAVLAQRTDKVLGEGVALVDIAADLAHKALLLGLGLGLYVLLVVGVGHGLQGGEVHALGHVADEHDVGLKIQPLNHLAGDVGVGVLVQKQQ